MNLQTQLKDRKLTRDDVCQIVAKYDKKDKKKPWKESVKFDLEELSDVLDSGVINKVLNDLDSYDH